jgi:DNA-binding MarR family transcriptional regulator
VTTDRESGSDASSELMKAMTRLRARLRAESAPGEIQATWSQLTTLARIVEEGPTTTSALADVEHVRRQSMAETVAALKADGLIEFEHDPRDRRKTLISATRKGRTLSKTIPKSREAWLNDAIRSQLKPDEVQTLLQAAGIMNRIADAGS